MAVPAAPEPLVTPTVVKVERIKPAVATAATETPAATETRPSETRGRQTAARAVEPATPADVSSPTRTAPVALQQDAVPPAAAQTTEAPAATPAPVVTPPPAKPRKTARTQSRHYESSYRSRDYPQQPGRASSRSSSASSRIGARRRRRAHGAPFARLRGKE